MVNNTLGGRWDHLTEISLRLGGWTPDFVQEAIVSYFDQIINGKNLDLCCGYYPHVTGSVGVDISPFALTGIKMIGEKINREYASTLEYDLNVLQDQSQLPIKDSEFDSATLIAGWNYIQYIEKLIVEVDRVVAPKGLFYVVQFMGNSSWTEDAFRKDDSSAIMEEFSSLGYMPKQERIDFLTDVVIVETK